MLVSSRLLGWSSYVQNITRSKIVHVLAIQYKNGFHQFNLLINVLMIRTGPKWSENMFGPIYAWNQWGLSQDEYNSNGVHLTCIIWVRFHI